MTVIHANGKFPKLLLAQKQRLLLKQCRTQQFGFHWTGFVVSTYITSIWSLEGDAEFKLLIAPPESRWHFKDLWWLARSPKEIFSPWTFGLISYQTPTELWKSDLWKLIFNGCESRKSSLISCLMCSVFGTLHLNISVEPRQNAYQAGTRPAFCRALWMEQESCFPSEINPEASKTIRLNIVNYR